MAAEVRATEEARVVAEAFVAEEVCAAEEARARRWTGDCGACARAQQNQMCVLCAAEEAARSCC